MTDNDRIGRLRTTTFPLKWRGYDEREVQRFLDELADWLEAGADEAGRSELIRRELAKVGERTGTILEAAQEAAESLRGEAAAEARRIAEESNEAAESLRASAEEYAKRIRGEADAHASSTREEVESEAQRLRQEADGEAQRLREQAAQEARERRESGEREAEQLLERARTEKLEIEAEIDELLERRGAVIGDLHRLTGEIRSVVGESGYEPADEVLEAIEDEEGSGSAAELLTPADDGEVEPTGEEETVQLRGGGGVEAAEEGDEPAADESESAERAPTRPAPEAAEEETEEWRFADQGGEETAEQAVPDTEGPPVSDDDDTEDGIRPAHL